MSTRRSARIQQKKVDDPQKNVQEEAPTPEEEARSTVTKSGKKRAVEDGESISSAGPVKRARTRGKLARVMDLPYDLLPNIFGHLDPIDLLNLSRTSKDFHNTLMSRSSRPIWVAALSNVEDVPDCPKNVPEPQFVNFVFGEGCMGCGKRIRSFKNKHEILEACTRLCSACLPIQYQRVGNEDKFVASRPYPHHIFQCLAKYYRYDDDVYGPAKLFVSRSQDKQWTEEYSALKTPEEKADWENRVVAEHHANREFSSNCSSFMCDLSDEKEEAEANLREEGIQRIVDHIRIMGWGEEIDRWGTPNLYHDGEMPMEIERAITKTVTPRILKNMEPFLKKYMEERKEARLQRERRKCLSSRAYALSLACEPLIEKAIPAFVPRLHAADVLEHPRVKDVLYNTPQDIELEPKDFEFVQELMPEIIQNWMSKVKTSLIAMITDTMGEEYITKVGASNVLSLATSVFACKEPDVPPTDIYFLKAMGENEYMASHEKATRCARESIWFEDALSHGCCSPQWNQRRGSLFGKDPWTNKLVFKQEESNALHKVVMLSGCDPNTTTVEDMDAIDPIFECVLCRTPTQPREIMNWRGVIQHFRTNHTGIRLGPFAIYTTIIALVLLKGEDAEEGRKRIAEAREKKIYRHELNVLCMHCDHSAKLAPMKRHLFKEHQILKPVEGTDFQLSGENPNCHPTDPVQLWPPYVAPIPGSEPYDPFVDARKLFFEATGRKMEDEA
ncbi:hypothetical protein CVT24_001900 [Panaeolus cyanescens]|uniref:F-box domain-containing protein n=1 Tax=Panaeolus cyanescens TaxID=181874 RepID=A0A409YEI8_9AGAR|nr:hypothetical protein CVT24_001900 [Panaeolus cyanescens]